MSRYCWLPTWSTPKNGSLCNLATRRPSESANSSSKAQNRPKCHRLRTGFSTCRKIGAETDLSVSSREEESVEKLPLASSSFMYSLPHNTSSKEPPAHSPTIVTVRSAAALPLKSSIPSAGSKEITSYSTGGVLGPSSSEQAAKMQAAIKIQTKFFITIL